MSLLLLIPFVVLLLAAVAMLASRPGRDILIPTFFVPWGALAPDVGVNLSLSKLLFLLLLIKYSMLGQLSIGRRAELPALFVMVLLGLAVAFFTLIADSSQEIYVGGIWRNGIFRVFVVTISFLFSVAPLLLLTAKNAKVRANVLLQVYIFSVFILCVIGIVQFAVFVRTGVDILPLGILSVQQDLLRSGIGSSLGGGLALRPGSLAGEPKALGMYAASAIVLLVIFSKNKLFKKGTNNFILLTAFVTIILTQSTSALFILPLGIGTFFCLRAWNQTLKRKTIFLIYFSTMTLVSLGAYYQVMVSPEPSGDNIVALSDHPDLTELLYSRTVGRAGVEDFDWVILKKFTNEPKLLIAGRGFGLGHLGTEPYIPEVWRYYVENRVVFPKMGATYFLVSGGFLMLLLISYYFARITPILKKTRPAQDRRVQQMVRTAQSVCIIFFLMMSVRVYVIDVTFLMMGIGSLIVRQTAIGASNSLPWKSRYIQRNQKKENTYPHLAQ